MTELNRTHIPDEEWKAFIKDIVSVQDKHKITLIPSISVSPISGVKYEWGGLRYEAPNADRDTADKKPKNKGS